MVIVLDLDGVVYRGETPVPGAVPSLNLLSQRSYSLFFLTNNSTRSRRHYAQKLARMGIPARPDQVVTSSHVTGCYLSERGAAGRTVYTIGEEGMAEELALAGLRVLPDDTEEQADYVVVGLDRKLTYARLARAYDQVRGGAAFIATNRDATYPIEGGREIPGGGAMVAALACATGVEPVTVGKPETHPWRLILSVTGAAPEEALMVGDRAETDILGAKRLGMRTALVLTGVTRAEEVPGLPEECQPDVVLPSLAGLPPLVEEWEAARQVRRPGVPKAFGTAGRAGG
ncbi:MAG: HAD-IIA family hydrolase [Armatimonadetes bacterium]|nr:HAD-IIA family hydrolase [Armatimonadota bacterium]